MSSRLERIQNYVKHYCRLGMHPIPIADGSKNPLTADWQKFQLTMDEALEVFGMSVQNVGMTLGINNLADIDLDALEAVRIGKFLLPETDWVFGRESKLDSHYVYILSSPVSTIQLRDPVKKIVDPQTGQQKSVMVIELRCLTKGLKIGLFTLFPPSQHPSGEEIRFARSKQANAGPPTVDADHLVRTVHRIGAAALFAAHWVPSGGGRHDCMLALSGALVMAGWSAEETFEFCDAVYRSLPDLDPAQIGRVQSEVSSTYEKHVNGQRITGAARLAELIDAKVVKTALSWLHITEAQSAVSETEVSGRKAGIEITGKAQEELTNETLALLYQVNTPPKIFTQLQSVVEILRDKRNNITVKEVHSPTLRHHIHRATRSPKRANPAAYLLRYHKTY